MKRYLVPAFVVALFLLTACGSTEKVVQPTINASIGQQLIDLKKAHEAGAMDQGEYERQREMLIDSVDR